MKSEKWYAAMYARRGNATNQYTKAKKLGLPKPKISDESRRKMGNPTRGKPKSEDVKRKISESRTRFLKENSDMVPYKLNHYSKGRSYPEQYWKEILDNNKVSYEEQYQIGMYQLDFAFLDRKIDLEIDGDQHYLDERVVESDRRRTKYLSDLGWTTIRIRWSDYLKLDNKEQFVSELICTLSSIGRAPGF